jgi:uncharacterized protein
VAPGHSLLLARRSVSVALAALALAVAVTTASAAEVPTPPRPTRWVTDTAGMLSPATARALDARLEAYTRETGHYVLVWIGSTTGDTPLEEFTVRAAHAWDLGKKGTDQDDAAVLFVFPDDKKMRVEVGYGLEGQLTDAFTSRVMREIMAPRLLAGDPDGAVTAGVQALLSQIEGKPVEIGAAPGSGGGDHRGRRGGKMTPAKLIGGGIVLVLFLILLVTNPSLAMFLLYSLMSGGHRGGGFGGGGGRSGGGGGFGGGGAGFGGGGASGSW